MEYKFIEYNFTIQIKLNAHFKQEVFKIIQASAINPAIIIEAKSIQGILFLTKPIL